MDGDISFVGLGSMGFPMATNVRRKMSKDKTLFIFDVNSDACRRFQEGTKDSGRVEIVGSSKEAASKSNTLISIVPESEHVRQVYLDKENGIIAAPKSADRLMCESSTIDSATSREVGKTIMDAGLGRYVDTPVSGGARGAKAGTLAFMIGCPADDPQAKRIREVVSMMGAPEKTFCCGELGTGNAAKISNNYMSGTVMVALSEAMAIGIRAGIDRKVLYNVILNSSGQTWIGSNDPPAPGILDTATSSNDYRPTFRHMLMIKDMSLGIDAGQKMGIEPTMAQTALESYKKAEADPETKGKHYSSVYLHKTGGERM